MKSNEFYNEFNKKIIGMNLEELTQLINNLIRKIPESKYNEVLDIFNNNSDMNESNICKRINGYKKQFNKIDEFELYFHATGYEDYGEYYNPWGGDWIWEYTDEDNIGELINNASLFAIELTNKRFYKYAKELLDIIIYTNFQVLDEDGGDNFEISLKELKENNLINIDINTLCLYAIYATYQSSLDKEKVNNIYEYFKNENFRDILVEDSFKLGTEVLNNIDFFWENWIKLLLTKPGNIEYRLLKDALIYNNYYDYKKYIDDFAICHPKIYIDLFNWLLVNDEIDEIVNIGNKALLLLSDDLKIKSDIALYLAKFDNSNKEKYLLNSFTSNTNIPNLVRIINNGFFFKHAKEIENIIIIGKDKINYENNELVKNIIDKETYFYLNFFIGKFDLFFKECSSIKCSLGWSGSFIQYAVYLWLIYLNENINSKVYNKVLFTVFNELNFKDNTSFLDEEYSKIFIKWKENFAVINKEIYLDWLKDVIDKRVDEIVSNGHRKSYYKAAILVVALGEVLDSNNIQNKLDFVNYYHQKYSRRSSFRKELNEYI